MSELFGVGVSAINKHLKNIFDEGELDSEVVISKMEIATEHGAIEGKTQSREVNFYNLDAIIAVGYRVNSYQATQFFGWWNVRSKRGTYRLKIIQNEIRIVRV